MFHGTKLKEAMLAELSLNWNRPYRIYPQHRHPNPYQTSFETDMATPLSNFADDKCFFTATGLLDGNWP